MSDSVRTPVDVAPDPAGPGATEATFVFADLAGYTALTEAHGDEQAADAAADFARGVRELMGPYGAQEVKTIGDALLIRVARADDAIHLAARIVGDQGARHRSLGVRVGMHTGNAVCRDGDFFGAAVNLASRIADAARSGEVLLSRATADAAGAAVLPGQLQGRGRRHLKNVGEPVELVALVPERVDGPTLPVDPVCRMAIDPVQAAEHRVHRGLEFHLCSSGCAAAFDAAPERYARRPSRSASLRVSDEARDSAARRVARAYADGRIDADELEDRTERVWSARTREDLHAVTHDLPRRRGPAPVWSWPFVPGALLVRAVGTRLRGRGRARGR